MTPTASPNVGKKIGSKVCCTPQLVVADEPVEITPMPMANGSAIQLGIQGVLVYCDVDPVVVRVVRHGIGILFVESLQCLRQRRATPQRWIRRMCRPLKLGGRYLFALRNAKLTMERARVLYRALDPLATA